MQVQQFQVAIKAFVLGEAGLLLVRESDGERLWELPGGRIDVGEEELPPAAVLLRELREELGPAFECEIGRPVAAWTRPPNPPVRNPPVFLLGYVCRYRAGEIQLSPEHVEFMWASAAQARELDLAPGYEPALAEFWRLGLSGA